MRPPPMRVVRRRDLLAASYPKNREIPAKFGKTSCGRSGYKLGPGGLIHSRCLLHTALGEIYRENIGNESPAGQRWP